MRRLAVGLVLLSLSGPAAFAQSLDARLDDLRTAAQVEQALGAHDALRAFDYLLRVDEGVLTIRGALPNQTLRQEALALAATTAGVQEVIDSLAVPPVAADSAAAPAEPDVPTPSAPPAVGAPDLDPEAPAAQPPSEPLPPTKTAPASEPEATLPTYHTVERGDTLFAIARRYGTTVADLRRLNDLPSNTLNIGQQIRVR